MISQMITLQRTISYQDSVKDYEQRFSHRECHCVHLHEHLNGEEGEEDEVGVLLELVQPLRLVVVLRRLAMTQTIVVCGGVMITWMIVLRKTRVMISQNMNWDLQMYRTVRRFFRFHLDVTIQQTQREQR